MGYKSLCSRVINPYVWGYISYVWGLQIRTFGGLDFLRLLVRNPYVRGLDFFRLGVTNAYVCRLDFLRLGVLNPYV